MEANNMKVMCKAVEDALWYLNWMDENADENTDNKSLKAQLAKPIEILSVALSEPPRNCDVGTPEEQARRFDAFCCVRHFPSEKCCSDCPCHGADRCEFKWGQLPYEEGDGKK